MKEFLRAIEKKGKPRQKGAKKGRIITKVVSDRGPKGYKKGRGGWKISLPS